MYVYTSMSRNSYSIFENIRIIPILQFFIISNQQISAFINNHETQYFALLILSMKRIKCSLSIPTASFRANLAQNSAFL